MSTRQAVFEKYIESIDPKVKGFKADAHRFIVVEKDNGRGETYLSGYDSLRGACDYLAREVESCSGWPPEFIVDLDTGEKILLDVKAFVVPQSVDAVALLAPRPVARAAWSLLSGHTTGGPIAQFATILQRSIGD
jgi:hypothetical protein